MPCVMRCSLLNKTKIFGLSSFLFICLPTHAETYTMQGIKGLNQEATRLLDTNSSVQKEVDEELTKLGLDPSFVPKLKDIYKVQIPESTDCFYENNWAVFSDWDISGSSDYNIMARNIKAAVNFIKDVHVSTRGQDLGYFHPRIIEFCPAAMMNGRSMMYQGRRLTIGLKNPSGVDQYEAVTSKSIMDMWDRGDLFANADDDAGFLESVGDKVKASFKEKDPRSYGKKAWFLINPIGKIRSALRELLHKKSMAFRSELQQAKTRADLQDIVAANVDDEKVKEDIPYQQSPAEWIATLNNEELKELKRLWLKQLSSASITEAVGEGVIEEMQTPVYSEKIEINVEQKGKWVAVENAHFIQAAFTLTTDKVKRFVTTTVPREMKINVKQEANVVVSTKDIISAFGNVVLPRSKMLESLSFLDVMEKMKKIQRQKSSAKSESLDEP